MIGDITDPAYTLGLDFTVSDTETLANDLVLSATSSNVSVVPNSNILITGSGSNRSLTINPSGVGNTVITVSVFDGTQNSTYQLNYSALLRTPDIDPTGTFCKLECPTHLQLY